MRLAYFTQPVHPVDRDYRAVLRENIEAIVLADRLGYEEALVGEHFTDLAEPITSALMFLARVAPETVRIRLGPGVVNLPAYHPAMMAGHVAMIDNMLDGRFVWGIGPGGQASDIEVFGNARVDRNRKMIEAFDQIQQLWWGAAPYDLQGEFYQSSTVRTFYPEIGQGIAPKPLQRPHPPVRVTALAPHSHGITLAAERGWDVISCQYVQAHWIATHRPKYLEGRRNAGLPEDTSGWHVAKCIFVADDEATARRYARGVDGPYGFYFSNLMRKIARGGRLALFATHPGQPESEITVEQSLATQVIAGTVPAVVDQLLALREQVGAFGRLYYTGIDWADPALGRRSMTLMAEEVMPRVRAALR